MKIFFLLMRELYNDIALIHLDTPIHFVTPAKLNYTPQKHRFQFIAAGYGKHGTGDLGPIYHDDHKRGFSNYSYMFDFEPWHSPSFVAYFPKPYLSTNDLEGIGAYGDSGSAVFKCDHECCSIVGIINLLSGDGKYGSANFILPIAPYAEWIEANRSQ